jgi:hypothetical protein
MTKAYIPAALALAALAGSAAQAGHVRIACDGAFQVVHGQFLATPYCESQNLASVARTYGMRVTADAIRYSHSTKASICQAIGYDNRVRSACQGYLSHGGGVRIP